MSWKETKHGGLRYVGDDSGCVSITIWEAGTEDVSIELDIHGVDIDFDTEQFKRLAAIMLKDINGQFERALDSK